MLLSRVSTRNASEETQLNDNSRSKETVTDILNNNKNSSKSNSEMPCRDFTPEDIVTICCDIARRDNIGVQVPNKKSGGGFFRRISNANGNQNNSSSSNVDSEGSPRSAQLSCQYGIPSTDANDNTMAIPQRNPVASNITGLKGRDVVAMAILVDDNGNPIRTYTETQKIPSNVVDSANKIFMSRVPVATACSNELLSVNKKSNSNSRYTPLADLLEDMPVKQSTKLLKRMERILIKLHTTDLNTALSFLKVERYKDVRSEAKNELLSFAIKELKVTL